MMCFLVILMHFIPPFSCVHNFDHTASFKTFFFVNVCMICYHRPQIKKKNHEKDKNQSEIGTIIKIEFFCLIYNVTHG